MADFKGLVPEAIRYGQLKAMLPVAKVLSPVQEFVLENQLWKYRPVHLKSSVKLPYIVPRWLNAICDPCSYFGQYFVLFLFAEYLFHLGGDIRGVATIRPMFSIIWVKRLVVPVIV